MLRGVYKYLIGVTCIFAMAVAAFWLFVKPVATSQNLSGYYKSSLGAGGFIVKDIDDDGNDELFVYDLEDASKYISLVDHNLNSIGQVTLEDHAYQSILSWADTDSDGILEIGVPYIITDSFIIQFYKIGDADIRRGKRIAFPQGKGNKTPGFWDGFYRVVGMIDANDDGRKEILFHVHTSYNYQPRALFAYDPVEENKIWYYQFGAAIGYFDIGDFNGDGQDEILMGSQAFTNGSPEGLNGTNDYHSYIIMLDRKGERLLQKELGGKYSWCSVAGLPYDEQYPSNLFAFVHPSASDEIDSLYHLGRIVAIDPATKIITKENLLGNQPDAYQKIDDQLNRMTWKSGLIANCNDGYIRVYDKELSLKYISRQYIGMNFRLIVDIDNDGYLESVFITEDNHLRIINNFMLEFAEYDVGDKRLLDASIVRRDDPGSSRIILQTEGVYAFGVPNIPNAQLAKLYVWVSTRQLILLFTYLGSVIIILMAWIIRMLLLENAISLKANELKVVAATGIIGVDAKNHLLHANRSAQSMIALPSKWRWKEFRTLFGPKEGGKFTQVLQKLQRNDKAIARQTLPLVTSKGLRIVGLQTVEKFSSYGESVYLYLVDASNPQEAEEMLLDWFDLSSSLMHGIKSPMTQILRSVELTRDLLHRDEKKQDVTVAAELDNAVDYIRQSINIADRFLQFRLKQVTKDYYNAHDLIQEAADYTMIPLGIPAEYTVEVDDPQLTLYTDREILKQLLSILIHNAVDAVENENGKIVIHCMSAQNMQAEMPNGLSEDTNEVLIVEDNGRGIPEDLLHRVFEPFYTTKIERGGHGLGLAIARKLCNLLGSEIVIESHLGSGTKVFIGFLKNKEQ